MAVELPKGTWLRTSWRVESSTAIGELTPEGECTERKMTPVVVREEKRTRSDYAVNGVMAGAGAGALGVGFAMGAGNEENGAANVIASVGALSAIFGVVGLLRPAGKPTVEERTDERKTERKYACASKGDFDGTLLEIAWPEIGARRGAVDASGQVKIPLGPVGAPGGSASGDASADRVAVRVVEPSRLVARLLRPGALVGHVDLTGYLASLVGPAAPDAAQNDSYEFTDVVRGDPAVRAAFSRACTPSGVETCGDAIDNDCEGTYDTTCGYAAGSVQWTLAWSTGDDLDLHVVGPDGAEVWAGNRQGGEAGLTLDRDCRGKFGAPCSGGQIENVFVARARKPMVGTYQAWVEVAQLDPGAAWSGAGTRKIDVRLAGRLAGKTYSIPLTVLAQARTRLFWAFAIGPDGDRDGIADVDDACPKASGRWSTVKAERGCPDRDGDGVADLADACPDAAGVRSETRQENGCPKIYGKARLTASGVEITEAILFVTGSAAISPQSHALLQDVATVMKKEPQRLKKVLLEGHTDDTGTPAGNVKLSKDRVTAVRDWLVKKGGIAADRFEIVWYGQDKPIDASGTAEGRAKNRRVVFGVIDPPAQALASW